MVQDEELFFIPENEVKLPVELDYSRAEDFIRCADAFARSTYQSVYIIDYFRKDFLYVSPNPLLLCGLTAADMMATGYAFYTRYVPEDEHALLLTLNKAGFEFYETLPLEERLKWYIQYDFHVTNNGVTTLVNHKLTPLTLTSDGRIWLALCVVEPSTHNEAGNVEMHRADSLEYFAYNIVTRRWIPRSLPNLTPSEKKMLTLSIQGRTMTEIAEIMCLSADTVKKYRRNIFTKFNVRNISEAIMAATNNRLL